VTDIEPSRLSCTLRLNRIARRSTFRQFAAHRAIAGRTRHRRSITHAAFGCIAKTLPLGTVAFEGQLDEKGERVIYLDDGAADRLGAMR
jgi:hypothetical protein